ncbi:MAG: 2-oxoacid:ferredoxin oxidoreductase subunit beta [archaeon]|nr:2-oxoacid:ferredoxin oxidoreductase subunit beta [archaeon]
MQASTTARDFDSHKPTWCPGCGDFALLESLKRALANLELNPKDVVIVSGIGCSSKITDYIKAYGFHGLHGRALPIAIGIKLANPRLTVIVAGGDGDGYAIGMGHFIHAMRRNIDITYIIMNNQIYGLTKGQYSPTSSIGFVTGTTPLGSKDKPIDGVALALVSGATYIARSFSGNIPQATRIIEEGIKHKGFSFIDHLSPCVTYNKLNTYDWFRQNIYNFDADPDYDPKDKALALKRVLESCKVPIGLIYKEERSTYEELILPYTDRPIVFEDLSISAHDYFSIMDEFL